MPTARFAVSAQASCRMEVDDDRIVALAPHALGLVIPFQFLQSEPGASGPMTWDLSYLYAELWSVREQGRALIGPALPEFTTNESRPTALRVPLSHEAVGMIDALRRAGDLQLQLHIQATLIGACPIDQVPDEGRRRSLEAAGLDREIVGPIRRSDDLDIQIGKLDWEEEIRPQWDLSFPTDAAPTAARMAAGSWELDVQALARTLFAATAEADFEQVLRQIREPIVGL